MTVPMFSAGGIPEFPKGETPVPRFRRGTSTQDCCCDNDTSHCICCAAMEGCESVPPTTATVTIAGFGANTDANFGYHKCDSGCDSINGTYVMGTDDKIDGWTCGWEMLLPVYTAAATSDYPDARILCTISGTRKQAMHVDWGGHDDCYPTKADKLWWHMEGWDYEASAMYASSMFMEWPEHGEASDTDNPGARPWKQGIKANGQLAYSHGDAVTYENLITSTRYVWHNDKLWEANTATWTKDPGGHAWRPHYIGPVAFDEDHWTEVPPDSWYLADGVRLTAKLRPDYINEGTHKLYGELWLGSELFEFAAYVDQEPAEGEACPLPIEATMTMDMDDPEKPGWFFSYEPWGWGSRHSAYARHQMDFEALCNWANNGDYDCATDTTEQDRDDSFDFSNPQRQALSITVKFHTPEE